MAVACTGNDDIHRIHELELGIDEVKRQRGVALTVPSAARVDPANDLDITRRHEPATLPIPRGRSVELQSLPLSRGAAVSSSVLQPHPSTMGLTGPARRSRRSRRGAPGAKQSGMGKHAPDSV
jgi:hypothetical protein